MPNIHKISAEIEETANTYVKIITTRSGVY